MIFIYRFLIGYVTIVFSGKNAEKLLNLFAKNNIKSWNMIYKNGYIKGSVDIASFKRIRTIKKDFNIKIHIESKHGLPFIINKYKKRSGILAGAVLFFIILKVMSLFLWNIEVNGQKYVKAETVISECESLGIHKGMYIKNIDTKNMPQKLVLLNNKLAWASFNIEGSKLTVDISEIAKNSHGKNMPSNIKSNYDGIITKINASSGDVLVQIGDTVKKGDILISGVKESLSSTLFLRSSGEVYATTVEQYSSYKPFKEKIYYSKPKIMERRIISLFNINVPLYFGKIGDIDVLRVKTSNLSINKEKLPVALIKAYYKQKTMRETEYKEKDIIEMLNKDIENKLNTEKHISVEQIDERKEIDNKGIKLIKTYKTERLVSYEEEITIDSIN